VNNIENLCEFIEKEMLSENQNVDMNNDKNMDLDL
jgi:hypothetical protein